MNFTNIKYLLSYIARGTPSEALQKLLEMTPSNLKTGRRMHASGHSCKRI